MKKSIKNIAYTTCIVFLMIGTYASGLNLSDVYKQLGLSEKVSYTADLAMEAQNLPQMEMKILFKNGDIRAEGNQGGMKFVTITKKDGTIYTYNDAMKVWMKTNMSAVIKKENIPEYKEAGKEKVDGLKCKKFIAKDSASNSTSTIYVNDGMIYQVITIDAKGQTYTVKYKNIEKTKLEDSLFMPEEGANVQDLSSLMQGLMANKDLQE